MNLNRIIVLFSLLPACGGNNPALVDGDNLKIQDVSKDGDFVAYTNNAGELFVVATQGGTPQKLSDNIDRARFEAGFLTIFTQIQTINAPDLRKEDIADEMSGNKAGIYALPLELALP